MNNEAMELFKRLETSINILRDVNCLLEAIDYYEEKGTIVVEGELAEVKNLLIKYRDNLEAKRLTDITSLNNE